MSPLGIAPNTVAGLVAERLRERTRGPDGWPRAWAGGIVTVHGRSIHLDFAERAGSDTHFEMNVWFDRDRCPRFEALALARALEAELGGPPPLCVVPVPTRRVDWVARVVRDHFETCEARTRPPAGISLGRVEPVVAWEPGHDRIVVEMYAESSADEGRAEELGRAWLAELVERLPEYASIVRVVGLSH